jgi:integrase
MAKVPTMREPHRQPRDIFTDSERGLLETLPTPDGELWTILFRTGLRRGEARSLKREHIDVQRAQLRVLGGKGGKDRTVALPPSAMVAVGDLDLFERLDPADHLWYRPRYRVGDRRRRSDPIGNTTFHRWYQHGIETAGVRYLNPHQTRHTYGWWLRGEGFDIEERQLLMGHESINTTQRYYGHLSVDDLAEKMAGL